MSRTRGLEVDKIVAAEHGWRVLERHQGGVIMFIYQVDVRGEPDWRTVATGNTYSQAVRAGRKAA